MTIPASNHQAALEQARRMYNPGCDPETIRFHLYEKGFEKPEIDVVIPEIIRWNRQHKRQLGIKRMVVGAVAIAAGLLLAFLQFSSDSPIIYGGYSLAFIGILIAAKGLLDFIGI